MDSIQAMIEPRKLCESWVRLMETSGLPAVLEDARTHYLQVSLEQRPLFGVAASYFQHAIRGLDQTHFEQLKYLVSSEVGLGLARSCVETESISALQADHDDLVAQLEALTADLDKKALQARLEQGREAVQALDAEIADLIAQLDGVRGRS